MLCCTPWSNAGFLVDARGSGEGGGPLMVTPKVEMHSQPIAIDDVVGTIAVLRRGAVG